MMTLKCKKKNQWLRASSWGGGPPPPPPPKTRHTSTKSSRRAGAWCGWCCVFISFAFPFFVLKRPSFGWIYPPPPPTHTHTFRGERSTPLKLLFLFSPFSASYWKPPSKRRPTLKDKGARQNLSAGQVPRHDTSMAWQRRRCKEEETPEREILRCSSSALIRAFTIALPNPLGWVLLI